jgi:glutathione S-transferase
MEQHDIPPLSYASYARERDNMSELKVLGRLTSGNVMKVVWTLTELGLPFSRQDVGGKFGGNDTSDYLALNPNGLVPTLIDGGLVLWESNTICRYLCNKVGPTSLYPVAPAARALCERWMDWQLSTLSPPAALYWKLKVRTPAADQDHAAIAAARAQFTEKLQFLDRTLAVEPHIAGVHLTLADVACGQWAHRWFALGGDHTALKHLSAWYERLKARPGYATYVVGTPIE